MVIVRLSGGMGNQMFQYAFGRALSLRHNVPLKLDTTFLLQRITMPNWLRPAFTFRDFDLDIFNISATIANPSDMRWWQRPILGGKISVLIDAVLRKVPIFNGWEKSFAFNPDAPSLGPDTYLVGFWQCEKYFSNIRDIIRSDFTLKDPLSEKSKELLDEIKSIESLCLHVRRSDYTALSLRSTLGQDYYDRALSFILGKHTIKKIYIFSDDPEWCRANLSFSIPSMVVGMEYAGFKQREHFALMSACNHFIISGSTFAWWAAWLGNDLNKTVIAPDRWFSNDRFSSRDVIPDQWYRI